MKVICNGILFLMLNVSVLSISHAEQVTSLDTLSKDSKILAYVLGDFAKNNLINIGKRMDTVIGIECSEEYSIDLSPSLIAVMEPINFPSDSTYPTAGAWQYRFDLKRCNNTKTYNAFAMTQPNSAPKFGALIPGKTLASPTLVRDTYQTVAMKVAYDEKMKRQRECKDIVVKDTRVTIPPKIVTTGNVPAVSGRYEEEWLVRSCGTEVVVPICFTAKADGGTSFSVQLCKDV